MTSIPKDLIAVLADEYLDVRDARAVWVRAGGKNSDVENVPRPNDLWQNLWLRSLRGASVRPAALLRAVLDDLPNNSVVIHHLSTLANPTAAAAATRIVDALESSEETLGREGVLELLEEWEVVDDVDTFAAICPALEGRISPERRGELGETLALLGEEVRGGALSGLVKVSTAAAVKAFFAALPLT